MNYERPENNPRFGRVPLDRKVGRHFLEMNMEKLCVFCTHLEYAEGGVGEYAEPAELFCKKKHKLLCDEDDTFRSQSVYDIEDFRRMIKAAENCHDYTPPDRMNSAAHASASPLE